MCQKLITINLDKYRKDGWIILPVWGKIIFYLLKACHDNQKDQEAIVNTFTILPAFFYRLSSHQ